MKAVLAIILLFIFTAIQVYLGGSSIGQAIEAYKNKQYTRFGCELLIALLFVITLTCNAIEYCIN